MEITCAFEYANKLIVVTIGFKDGITSATYIYYQLVVDSKI